MMRRTKVKIAAKRSDNLLVSLVGMLYHSAP